ncbi:MAG: glycosyltransferase family 4 protein [Desulfovermiculus sp.]|nr:glycosyltransferase family 4 protein [Desulfovermiculus sp.]
MKKKSHVDIMHFIALKPIKRGSFEDFIIQINTELNRRNKNSIFIFDDQISPQLKKIFAEKNVQYKLEDLKERQGLSLFRCLRQYRPKICHFHFVPLSLKIIIICSLLRIHVLYTIHDSLLHNDTLKRLTLKYLFKRIKRKLVLAKVSKIIAVSEFVHLWMKQQYYVSDNKLVTIYNGVDIKRFQNTKKTADNKIVFIGQLIHEKGVHVLIEAINILQQKMEIQADIIGDGSYKNHLENLVANHNLTKCIHFHGVCYDVRNFLNMARVLVCPSIWYEAFGLVIIEAMASRVPVIASRCGGIPEIITHEETGLLVPPGDAVALSEAIYMIINNLSLRQKIIDNAYTEVENKFNINLMTNTYVSLYVDQTKNI